MLEAAAMFGLFVAALFVASALLPGRRVTGRSLDGASHVYRLNGLGQLLLVAAVVAVAWALDWFSPAGLHSHFAELFIVANGFAFALSGVICGIGGRGSAGSAGLLRGFIFGRRFNPRWLGVDLKLFSYRPSLIGLALLNASFGVAQYEADGAITLAMALYQAFTLLYVFNYFQFERGMIFTWDMVSERFGWMLIWGDYVLVPFFYSIAGWWLLHASVSLSPPAAAALGVLFGFGFWMFRGANEQKHRFKADPSARIWGRPARSLDGRLLVSGFWGVGRHLNYTGEICIYLAFTLTTGFVSWVPYLLPAWLMGLLWHRSRRDERRCRAKYGELWERYTQQVPYSMVPFLY